MADKLDIEAARRMIGKPNATRFEIAVSLAQALDELEAERGLRNDWERLAHELAERVVDLEEGDAIQKRALSNNLQNVIDQAKRIAELEAAVGSDSSGRGCSCGPSCVHD